MNKSPTETIYNCLTSGFWTQRKCRNCQELFTQKDYHQGNYYLTFTEVLTVWEHPEFPLPLDNACFETTVRLFHQHCPLFKPYPSECSVEIIKETTNNHE